MDYSLAKKLKDAGFPQKGNLGARYYHFISHPRMGIPAQWAKTTQIAYDASFDKTGGYILIPTLEELIIACGDRFDFLGKGILEKWRAQMTDEAVPDCVADCCGYKEADTPSAAVALLWLSLQESNK